MPRAIWSGSISFGLINIPVKLFSAISEKSVRFNQIDTRNGARIRTRKVNAEDGSDVPPDVDVSGSDEQVYLDPQPVEDPLPECFAPVTSVAVVGVR